MNITENIISLLKKELYQNIKLAFKVQYKSREELLIIQKEKFEKLIAHAKLHVPYYREKLAKVSTLKGIERIDFLDKKGIRKNTAFLKATNIEKERFIQDYTSGSTGESLYYYRDSKNYYRRAATYRDDARAGYSIGAKAINFWGAERDILKDKSLYVRAKDNYIHKKKMLSTSYLSEEYLKEYIDIYNKYKPEAIISYPSPLYHIANFIEKNNIKIWYPKGIITSAERLFPFQREKIEQVFNSKIYNRYGSREFGHIASECKEHNGMHIHVDRFVLETINEKGEKCKPGELGEIVITDLDEYAFPMIRYKTGDLGILSDEKCSCGIGLPLLKSIEGRVFDLVLGSNGNVVGGVFWPALKHKVKGWSKFQIIQDKKNHIKAIVEKNNEMEEDFEEVLKGAIKEKLGNAMEIEIDIVDKIPLTKTGKHRWVISKMSPYA